MSAAPHAKVEAGDLLVAGGPPVLRSSIEHIAQGEDAPSGAQPRGPRRDHWP